MKPGVKIAVGLLSVLLIVLVIAVVAVKLLVTPERVKEVVVPLAEKQLQRKVLLGDVDISLFTGIQLKDFAVRSKDDTSDFVATDALVLTYQFMPLLSGKVVVDEARLVNPRIRIERYKDGNFNFSDLLPTSQSNPAESDSDKPASTSEEGAAIPIQLAQAAVENGTLEFIDHSLQADKPYRLLIEEVGLQLQGFAPGQAADLQANALINGALFTIAGQVKPDDQSFDLESKLVDLDIIPLAPYFQQALPGTLQSMVLAFTIQAKGDVNALETAGSVEAKQLSLQLKDLPEAPIENANFRVTHTAGIQLKDELIKLRDLDLQWNKIAASVNGQIRSFLSEPQVALQVQLPQSQVGDLLSSLPSKMVQPATQFSPSGQVEVGLTLEGAVSDPVKLLKSGVVRLSGISGKVAGYAPQIDGTLKLNGKALNSEGLVAQVAQQTVNIDLNVQDLLTQPVKGSVGISADKISLTAIKEAGQKGTTKEASKGAASSKGSGKTPASSKEELGPYDIPVDLTGTIRIREAEYNKIIMSNLATDFTLRKNILTVDPVKAEVGEGTLGGTARVNLGVKGLAYRSNIGVQKVAIEKVIGGFWPQLAGAIFGRISLDLSGDGRGTQWENLKRNLNGKGQLELFQGKLASSALTQSLVEQTKINELEQMSFSKIALDFLVDKGRVSLGGNADGKEARFAPKGQVDADGSLDMNLGMKLAPNLADKAVGGKLGSLLKDNKGWATIPLKLGGTLTAPQVLLDEAALQKQAIDKGKQKIQEKLEKKLLDKVLKPSKSDPSGGKNAESDPQKQLLDNTLKKLLGQ